ncbi:MAG: OmpA family protein [Bacteroidales bacterium]|nr:OmpA family protein [Bacteroidales bacterium]
MRKSIIVSAFVACACVANAQTGKMALEGTGIGDNWSMELKAGGVTPLTHNPFFKSMRPAFGFGIGKQLTPVIGLGIQGMGYVNTSQSKTAFDASEVSLIGKVNLMNLFGSYTGKPRVFEMEAVAGAGWLHYYQDGPGDANSWSTRFGMNLNFNMGESRAWTFGIKPAIVYDMQGDFNRHRSRFNANNASFELTAGLTYHFMNGNGKRYFTTVRPYDEAEVADLNATINDLRWQVDNQNAQLMAAAQQVDGLQQELDDCRNQAVPVETIVETNHVPESIVSFKQGKSSVDASQLPNVERVASYMKRHTDAQVIIKGYASPEGNLDFNERLAAARAEAVKSILVNKYKIDASRITAQGQGVGDMFSEPDWNRVSICTLND